MTLDFGGLVVLVTGAGRGLGRHYARAFGARGAHVVVSARDAGAAQAVVDEIGTTGGTAVPAPADPHRAVESAVAAFGGVDALVVNAGNTRDRSFGRMSDEEWSDVLAVHLDGGRRAAAAVWPAMRERGAGRIVFTGSGAGLHGNPGQANYAAAKAGLIGLAKTLALEGVRFGIAANVALPMALTDMTGPVFDDTQRGVLTADRVVPFVLALAHPSCPYAGEVIEVGGGWAAAVRWERAVGVRLPPDATADDVARHWADVVDFDAGSDHPTTIADSLAAAVGPHDPPGRPRCPTSST